MSESKTSQELALLPSAHANQSVLALHAYAPAAPMAMAAAVTSRDIPSSPVPPTYTDDDIERDLQSLALAANTRRKQPERDAPVVVQIFRERARHHASTRAWARASAPPPQLVEEWERTYAQFDFEVIVSWKILMI